MAHPRRGPLIIGHRGACGYRPEHTRSAYELAFALGADAVEPDIVATRDGVLVLRHENEISGTTDIASRPDLAGRRTTKVIDGTEQTGWFTEDFTWAELSTLRAKERLGGIRHSSMSFDGRFPIIRLRDLLEIIDRASDDHGREFGLVAEFKHASHFANLGLPLDELFAAELDAGGWGRGGDRLTMESFELTLLDRLVERMRGKRIFLVEAAGSPWDQLLLHGRSAPTYADFVTESGLLGLSGRVDGVSVAKKLIIDRPKTADARTPSRTARTQFGVDGGGLDGAGFVDSVHAAGLELYTWTLRPENRFLSSAFRRGRARGEFGDWLAEFTLIMSTGVDGVFVDHPDLGVEARAALAD